MKTKKRLKMSKFERLIYTFTAFVAVIMPLSIIFSQASLSKVNYDVEKIKRTIASQEKKNESLSMKIDELASLDTIQSVAKSQGLGYNNNNIKSILEGCENCE